MAYNDDDICGIDLAGRLACVSWEGPYGDSPPGDVNILAEGPFVALDSTRDLICALDEELELHCWGDVVDSGELPTTPCTVPQP
jgi:hypothetical protein